LFDPTRRIVDIVEQLGDRGSGSRSKELMYGIVVAALLALFGLWCIASRSALFLAAQPMRIVTYTGAEAVAVGTAYLSIALFLNSHWYWLNHERWHGIGQIGRVVSLLGLIGGIGRLIYNVVFLD
jgi:hypothetical protein